MLISIHISHRDGREKGSSREVCRLSAEVLFNIVRVYFVEPFYTFSSVEQTRLCEQAWLRLDFHCLWRTYME